MIGRESEKLQQRLASSQETIETIKNLDGRDAQIEEVRSNLQAAVDALEIAVAAARSVADEAHVRYNPPSVPHGNAALGEAARIADAAYDVASRAHVDSTAVVGGVAVGNYSLGIVSDRAKRAFVLHPNWDIGNPPLYNADQKAEKGISDASDAAKAAAAAYNKADHNHPYASDTHKHNWSGISGKPQRTGTGHAVDGHTHSI
jgi:hypothetical protein